MGYTSRKWQSHLLATGRGGAGAHSYSIALDPSPREPQECPQLRKLKYITQNPSYLFSELVRAQLVQGK